MLKSNAAEERGSITRVAETAGDPVVPVCDLDSACAKLHFSGDRCTKNKTYTVELKH